MVCKQNPGQASCDARGLLQSLAWLRLKNSLKVTAPFFSRHPSLLSFLHSLSLFFALKDAMLVMAVKTWRCWGVEEKSVADHFPFLWGAEIWCKFIFHSGLHDFRTTSHKRLRRKKMSENGSCLCATENGNCLYRSQTIERQTLLSGNSCGTFHTAICRHCTC